MNDRNARFSGGFWVSAASFIGLCLVGVLFAVAATAQEKITPVFEPPVVEPDPVSVVQDVEISANPVQAVTQTASPQVTANPSYSDRSTTIALGSTAPNVVQVSDCIVPARGLFKRGQGWLWGMFQLTPVTELDPLCVAEKRAEAQTELDRVSLQIRLIEAENEQERLIIERMRLEADANK